MKYLPSRGALRAGLHPYIPFTVVVLAAATLCATSASAQSQSAPGTTLTPVTVTGNPLGATDSIAPAAQYSGAELLIRSKSTLGETLDGTPGVSSSYFGPNASRPLIRGLDGDRILILQNSTASIDASGLSNDHAVASDPISVERVEVLRGPGALLYGGSAVGGVINTIDNRVPREPQFDARGGVSGRASLGLGSGDKERSGGLLVEAGTDRFTLHVDAFSRTSEDVAVPIALACEKPGAPTVANALCNSASQTRGGAVGGSVFYDGGRLGVSVSSYRSDYGTVAEDAVTIGMKSDRIAFEWDVNKLNGWFSSIKLRASRSDYQHTEFEDGAPGTTFKNAGNDLRIEARHANLGALQGLIGLQSETTNFSAVGEEAFAPYSRTTQTALFVFEELPLAWGRLSFGARTEAVTVDSMGNPEVPRFLPASRSFQPGSYAIGALWNAAPGWAWSSNLSYSERAPKDYELYADGPHLATHAYEVGLPNATLEQATNLDIGLQYKRGAHSVQISAFVNQFNNFLSQESTGRLRDVEGNGAGGAGVTDDGTGNSVESGGTSEVLPEYVFRQVGARFSGLEASGKLRLLDAAQTLDLELRADMVRAINTATNQPLPRIAPLRLGAALVWNQGPWNAKLEARHATAQNDVPPGDIPSSAYTLVNAALSYRMVLGTASSALWFARLDNIGDTLAYSATSVLTQTVPGKAPLPGRSLKLGVQVAF